MTTTASDHENAIADLRNRLDSAEDRQSLGAMETVAEDALDYASTLFAELEAARAERDDLQADLEYAEEHCHVHADAVHGAEAEELRQGIARIADGCDDALGGFRFLITWEKLSFEAKRAWLRAYRFAHSRGVAKGRADLSGKARKVIAQILNHAINTSNAYLEEKARSLEALLSEEGG